MCVLAGPVAAAGGRAAQDEGGFAVRTAVKQHSETVTRATEGRA